MCTISVFTNLNQVFLRTDDVDGYIAKKPLISKMIFLILILFINVPLLLPRSLNIFVMKEKFFLKTKQIRTMRFRKFKKT